MRWRGEIRRRAAPARQRQVVCPGSAASEADWQELEHDGALIHFPCPDNYLWPTFKANSTRNPPPHTPRLCVKPPSGGRGGGFGGAAGEGVSQHGGPDWPGAKFAGLFSEGGEGSGGVRAGRGGGG